MLRPQNCCLIKPTVFVSFLPLLKPPLHFPASRGLSLRGKNVRKEREISLLSLIFASSWETSASREPLHMRYQYIWMAEPCLKSHHCTAPATAVGLQNRVLANWNYTLFTSVENDMSLPLSASFTGWLQKMIEGRKGRGSVKPGVASFTGKLLL